MSLNTSAKVAPPTLSESVAWANRLALRLQCPITRFAVPYHEMCTDRGVDSESKAVEASRSVAIAIGVRYERV
jgi:hypothetical protein